MKKFLTLLLSAIILVSAFPLNAFAQVNADIEIQNPLYSGTEVKAPLYTLREQNSETVVHGGNTYYSSGVQLYSLVKEQLLKRETNFSVSIMSKNKRLNNPTVLINLLNELLVYSTDEELSTGYLDGDYLRWSVSAFGIDGGVPDLEYSSNGCYCYTIPFYAYYYTTDAEERQVDSVVNGFIDSLDVNSMSDYDIVKAVHDFICNKTTYDYEVTSASDYGKYSYTFSAYGALVKGKCVCQGYAAAFYRICRELGYSVRFVSSDPNKGKHAWNIIELDGKYYYVDCTWDDEIFDTGIKGLPDYYFFLVNYATVSSKDAMFVNEHVLDSAYYNTAYFNTYYASLIDTQNYDRGNLNLLSRSRVAVSDRTYTFDGTPKNPSVVVTGGYGNVLNYGTDYTVSYSGDMSTGHAKVNITGLGAYAGDKTHRGYYVYPSAAYGLSASSTDDTVNLAWIANGGGVTGYEVEELVNGNWVPIGASAESSAVVRPLNSATEYTFRIRPYTDVAKHRLYGGYSSPVSAMTRPAKTKIKSLKYSKKKLKIKWQKVKGTGYQLQYSTKKNMKGAKTVSIKGAKNVTKTLKKLKKNKKYYIRVRAYKRYNDSGVTKTVYGKWSAKKSVKCK